jgi:hypothetical protein
MASLGGFQFDNLVQGRIPFLFINLGVDTSKVYPHVFKMHLDRTLLHLQDQEIARASNAEILAGLQKMNYPHEMAIVVMGYDDLRAQEITDFLERENYKNVFFVRGGWNQLIAEKEAGF